MQADVAQLVEQLIRNQQVVSSSLTVGSRIRMKAWPLVCGRSFLLRLLRLSLHVHRDAGSPADRPASCADLCGARLAVLSSESQVQAYRIGSPVDRSRGLPWVDFRSGLGDDGSRR